MHQSNNGGETKAFYIFFAWNGNPALTKSEIMQKKTDTKMMKTVELFAHARSLLENLNAADVLTSVTCSSPAAVIPC